MTGLENRDLLIASHIKPWRSSDTNERLNGYNGLMLSPHIDRLFDRGYLSFDDNGDMLLSEVAKEVLQCWGITPKNVGTFRSEQKDFLEWHRKHIYKPTKTNPGA